MVDLLQEALVAASHGVDQLHVDDVPDDIAGFYLGGDGVKAAGVVQDFRRDPRRLGEGTGDRLGLLDGVSPAPNDNRDRLRQDRGRREGLGQSERGETERSGVGEAEAGSLHLGASAACCATRGPLGGIRPSATGAAEISRISLRRIAWAKSW